MNGAKSGSRPSGVQEPSKWRPSELAKAAISRVLRQSVRRAPARGPRQRKVFNLEVKHCKNRAKTRILYTPFEAKQDKERAQIGSKMRSGIIAV